jgi:hypothetical protein
MADQQQLNVLKRGVPAWNAWREQHPTVRTDLYKANLSEANLGARSTSVHGSAAQPGRNRKPQRFFFGAKKSSRCQAIT